MNSSAFFISTIKTHISSCCVHTKKLLLWYKTKNITARPA